MKEALKLALEALELPSMKTQSMLEQRDAAITAIKEVLAQLEQKPATKEQIREAMIFNLPLYTMPPHPDQEPVAWFTATPIEGNGNRVLYEQVSKQYNGTPDTIPLFTSPPQRKPLTDEEYSALAEQYTGADGLDCVDYGRAIARHYGIKE